MYIHKDQSRVYRKTKVERAEVQVGERPKKETNVPTRKHLNRKPSQFPKKTLGTRKNFLRPGVRL